MVFPGVTWRSSGLLQLRDLCVFLRALFCERLVLISWDICLQIPNAHNETPQQLPEDGLEGAFCRNPTSQPQLAPWSKLPAIFMLSPPPLSDVRRMPGVAEACYRCYNGESTSPRWEMCHIPLCATQVTFPSASFAIAQLLVGFLRHAARRRKRARRPPRSAQEGERATQGLAAAGAAAIGGRGRARVYRVARVSVAGRDMVRRPAVRPEPRVSDSTSEHFA